MLDRLDALTDADDMNLSVYKFHQQRAAGRNVLHEKNLSLPKWLFEFQEH
jgi:hypothetical protein